MVGNAAKGRLYRYRYYTCFSRQRYGKIACTAERLPADELDRAVLDALLKTYEDEDLFDRVARSTAGRSAADREQRESERAAVRSELSKTEEAIERYLTAFESGSLPEDQCGARVGALGARTAELRDRRGELQAILDALTAEPPTVGQIEALRNDIERAVEEGPVTARKSFVQALVQEVRADDRNDVVPTFRVPMNGQLPALVREPSRVVGRGGLEPPTGGL
jgi:site-specific DNA recombinase